LLFVETNTVAGQANHAFDVSLEDVLRVNEGDDIAALYVTIRQDVESAGTGL
jgi:hypothetical protein